MLRRPLFRVLLFVGMVAIILGGAFAAYVWVSGGEAASAPIAAPRLAGAALNETRTRLFIQPAESEVRFLLDEDLFGNRITVVGETDQVAGELLVDYENPTNSEIGTLRINMRTIATDNEFRNRALRSQILQTSEHEFAEFAASSFKGIPETITMGELFEFQIVGTLTVRGVSREVTFDATVTPVSETRLEGLATTEVLYSDFELTIPNAPGVANISDEVRLEIDFVATDAPIAEATAEA